MLTLALATALAQKSTITFEHPCANAAVVLEALGKEVGVPMRATGSVLQDYFLVRFKDVPVETAMQKIADTLCARWTVRDKTHWLERTPLDEHNESAAINKALAKKVEEYLVGNEVAPLPSVQDLAERFSELRGLDYTKTVDRAQAIKIDIDSPPKRAAVRILANLDLSELARMENGVTLAFSSAPTKFAQPYPPSVLGPIREMHREFSIMEEAVSRAGLTGHDNLGYTSLKWLARDSARPWAIQVDITKRETSIGVIIKNTVADDKGSGWSSMGGASVSIDEHSKPPESLLQGLDAAVELTDLSREIEEDIEGQRQIPFSKLNIATKTMLRNLRAHEPLSMSVSEALLQGAEAKGWNVVAVLSDKYFPHGTTGMRTLTLRESMSSVLMGSEWQLQDGFLSVKPRSPKTVRSRRHDREAFSRVFDRAGKSGWLDLSCMVELASVTVDEEHYWEAIEKLNQFFLDARPAGFRAYYWLRLLDTLVARDAWNQEEYQREFPFRAFTRRQEDALKSLLPKVQFLQFTKTDYGPGVVSTISRPVPVPDDYKLGVMPVEGNIKVSFERKTLLYASPRMVDGATYVSRGLTPEEYVREWTRVRDNEKSPDYALVRAQTTDTIVVHLNLPEGTATFETDLTWLATDQSFHTLDKLDPPLWDRLKAELKRIGGGTR